MVHAETMWKKAFGGVAVFTVEFGSRCHVPVEPSQIGFASRHDLCPSTARGAGWGASRLPAARVQTHSGRFAQLGLNSPVSPFDSHLIIFINQAIEFRSFSIAQRSVLRLGQEPFDAAASRAVLSRLAARRTHRLSHPFQKRLDRQAANGRSASELIIEIIFQNQGPAHAQQSKRLPGEIQTTRQR